MTTHQAALDDSWFVRLVPSDSRRRVIGSLRITDSK
jgi:hypothetical protein